MLTDSITYTRTIVLLKAMQSEGSSYFFSMQVGSLPASRLASARHGPCT